MSAKTANPFISPPNFAALSVQKIKEKQDTPSPKG